MLKMEFADIEYSKKLADLFPSADWWYWEDVESGEICFQGHKSNSGLFYDYPAITTEMALDLLPEYTKVKKFTFGYIVSNTACNNRHWPTFGDKYLVNALCEMIIYLKEKDLL